MHRLGSRERLWFTTEIVCLGTNNNTTTRSATPSEVSLRKTHPGRALDETDCDMATKWKRKRRVGRHSLRMPGCNYSDSQTLLRSSVVDCVQICALTCSHAGRNNCRREIPGCEEEAPTLQGVLEGFGVWRLWAARDGSDDERRELFSPQNTCRAVKYHRAELLLLMETSAETRQKKHPSSQPGNDKVVK